MPIPNFSDLLDKIVDGQSDAFDKLYQYSASDFSANNISLLRKKIGQIGNNHHAYPFRLALIALQYQKGIGEPVNHQLAFQFYERATRFNNACAIYCCAEMYQNGQGVTANLKEAVRLLDLAIDLEHVPSMSLRAWIYLDNEKNYENALELCEQAIVFDYAPALYNLAMIYQQKDFKGNNFELAKKYYTKAIELHHVPSMNNLAWLYVEVENNYKEASKLFKMAIREGSLTAINGLALTYEKTFEKHLNQVKPRAGRPEALNNLDLETLGEADRYLPKAWILYYQAYCKNYQAYCKMQNNPGLDKLQELSIKITDKESIWSIFLQTEPYKFKETMDPRVYLLERLGISGFLENVEKINDIHQQRKIATAAFEVFACNKKYKSNQGLIKKFLRSLALKQELEVSPVNPVFSQLHWPRFFHHQEGYSPLEVTITPYTVEMDKGGMEKPW